MKLRGLDRRTIRKTNDAMVTRQRLEASRLVVPETVRLASERFEATSGAAGMAKAAGRRFRSALRRNRLRTADKDTQSMVLTAMAARRKSGRPPYDLDRRGRAFIPIADLRDGHRGETRRVYLNRDLELFTDRRTRRARRRAGFHAGSQDEAMRKAFKGVMTRQSAFRVRGINAS